MLILSSEEFIRESTQNSHGKNLGKRTIKFNGVRHFLDGTNTIKEEYILEKYEKYVCNDFSKFY